MGLCTCSTHSLTHSPKCTHVYAHHPRASDFLFLSHTFFFYVQLARLAFRTLSALELTDSIRLPFAWWCFRFPVVRTFLTRSLGPAHFGNALGLLAFLQELSSLVAPLLKVAVWDLEVQVGFKGLSFLLFGAIGLLGFVFSLAVKFPKDSIDDATAQNAEHLVDVVAAGADGDPAHAEATKPDARSSSSCSQDAPLLLNDEGI